MCLSMEVQPHLTCVFLPTCFAGHAAGPLSYLSVQNKCEPHLWFFIATSWQRSPDPGHFPAFCAMELPGDWTPNLVRQSRGSLAFGDARAAAELSFPRRAGAPPPDLPVGCEVFELDSGCSEVETSSAEARRRLATTAQFYNEMESDTSLFETAADRRFAESTPGIITCFRR